MCKISILGLLSIPAAVYEDPPKCPTDYIGPCRCCPNTGQIRCENAVEGQPLSK